MSDMILKATIGALWIFMAWTLTSVITSLNSQRDKLYELHDRVGAVEARCGRSS